jgi:hypothetical protein
MVVFSPTKEKVGMYSFGQSLRHAVTVSNHHSGI